MSNRVKLAHIRQQGVDLIVVPLDPQFGQRPENEQHEVIRTLQVRATAAGLGGTVVPVWDSGAGRMAFIAPRPWHPFFASVDLTFVWRNVNRELSWN